MTIYVDDGKAVKIYPVKDKVAKAVMTLLELDNELAWCKTHTGYGVTIVDKQDNSTSDKVIAKIEEQENWLSCVGYTKYNVDSAFDYIKHVMSESEGKE